MVVSFRGHIEVVRLLIKGDADVDARDNDVRNALKFASTGGHTDIANLLEN
jgi:ankyrin repeat protein